MDSVVVNGDTFRGVSPWPKGGTTLDIPDFIVATTQGSVLRVCMRAHEARTAVLFRTPVSTNTCDDEALVLAAHPTQPHFAMAGRAGLLQLVDLESCLVRMVVVIVVVIVVMIVVVCIIVVIIVICCCCQGV